MGRFLGAFLLVQFIKRSLREILFRSTVNYEEVVTIVTEIDGIIDRRPLTYFYNDNTKERDGKT